MGSGKTAGCVKMWEFTWVFWSHWLESPLTGIWIFWWTVSTRLPCPSPSPGVCSDSNPLSRWCHQIIPPSVSAFSSCPQSLPESGSFPMSQFFASSGQNIGSFSISLTNEYSVWFPLGLTGLISLHLGLTGLISLQSKGLSRVFSNTTVQKHQFFSAQLFL